MRETCATTAAGEARCARLHGCWMWPCRDPTNTTRRTFQRRAEFEVPPSLLQQSCVYIYIYISFESYLNICQPSTFNLLDRLIVTRQKEREKKEASRVYEPCIIESHSRCMAAGLMQGSLFPRWPIHSPRDLGACMPCTYQRLLHDRSYYVSK